MSINLLEQIRSKMEKLEQLNKVIIKTLFTKSEYQKNSVMNDHRIKAFLMQVQANSLDALILLNDQDTSKKRELDILSGTVHYQKEKEGLKDPDVWANFYDRIKDIKLSHKKNSNLSNPFDRAKNTEESILENVFNPPYQVPIFSSEECNGKYVDMHQLFFQICNLRQIKLSDDYPIGDYVWYLQNFDKLYDIPVSLKLKDHKKYIRYVKNLEEYLRSFYTRIKPLTDIQQITKQIQSEFEQKWTQKGVKGWESFQEESSSQHLENVQNNAFYCRACEKLFAKQSVFINHLHGKKHTKNEEKLTKKIMVQQTEQHNEAETTITAQQKHSQQNEEIDKKNIAKFEFAVLKWRELLADVIHDSKNQILKKQTRTYNIGNSEIEDDINKDEENKIDSESEDESKPIYDNPKNVPLGWDGKPIPYWLYKLHGLGVEYKCEICGNYSYWGRRAFELHFSEWRHTYGMKCLKIPNTVHFKEVTSINDALALHQKLVLEQELSKFRTETQEEFEDSEGNVLNKKNYVDLKRQGLL